MNALRWVVDIAILSIPVWVILGVFIFLMTPEERIITLLIPIGIVIGVGLGTLIASVLQRRFGL